MTARPFIVRTRISDNRDYPSLRSIKQITSFRYSEGMFNRVLISGAGVAGLSLAHGLKSAGVTVHVFEREATIEASSRPFAMRITEDGKSGLKKILSPELWRQLVASSAEVGRESLDREGGATELPAVDRTVLRKLLLTNLSSDVSYGKEIMSYNITENGVTVFFKDGTSDVGLLLIGADGTSSAVRAQYLPDHQMLDTEGRLIWGKSPMTDDLCKMLVSELKSGVPDHISNGSTTLIVLPIVFEKSDLHAPDDYVYWVLCTNVKNTNVSTEDFSTLSKDEAAELAIQLANTLDVSTASANLKVSMLQIQDRQWTTPHVLLSGKPHWYAESWESSPVTIIGDAMHPLGMGAGGGAALKGVEILLRTFRDHGPTKESIEKYESEVRAYAEPLIRTASGRGHVLFGQPLVPSR